MTRTTLMILVCFSPLWSNMNDAIRSFYSEREQEINAYTASLPLGPMQRTMALLQHEDEQGLGGSDMLQHLIETGGPWGLNESATDSEKHAEANITLGFCLMHLNVLLNQHAASQLPLGEIQLCERIARATERAQQLEQEFPNTRWDWHVRHFLARRMQQYPDITFEAYLADPCNKKWLVEKLKDQAFIQLHKKQGEDFLETTPYVVALRNVAKQHRQPIQGSTLRFLPKELITHIISFLPLGQDAYQDSQATFFSQRVERLRKAIIEHSTEYPLLKKKLFEWLDLDPGADPSKLTPDVVKTSMEKHSVFENWEDIRNLLNDFKLHAFTIAIEINTDEYKYNQNGVYKLIDIYQSKNPWQFAHNWLTYSNPYASALIYLGLFVDPRTSLHMLGGDMCPPLIGCAMRIARLSGLDIATIWEYCRAGLLIKPNQHVWYKYCKSHTDLLPTEKASEIIDTPSQWYDFRRIICLNKLMKQCGDPPHSSVKCNAINFK